jgi:hypothetical protein
VIVYVNGDSHTAAAEAVNSAAFAEDDGYPELGRRPHPDNLRVSWGQQLADRIGADFVCDAESAASNTRILRTTRDWIKQLPPWESCVVIVQWSTWEREEWLHQGQHYQIGSSGLDWVPDSLKNRYRQFIADVDWNQCQQLWHNQIWQFHLELVQQHIPHFFFNGNSYFDRIRSRQSWGVHYLDPYGSLTYDQALRQNGFNTVNSNSWHFGKDAHCFWADFVLEYCIQNSIIDRCEIPTD